MTDIQLFMTFLKQSSIDVLYFTNLVSKYHNGKERAKI